MSLDAHKNFAYSTIATPPSPASSGGSLVVFAGDGTKFPAASFNATVWPANTQPTASNAEIVRVTLIATDTFTITRAQESSNARAIVVGDQIAATITAKTLTDAESLGGGTSGGVPYFNAATSLASSALLTASDLVKGGGAGAAPASWGVQVANTIVAGPISGAAAVVTSRAVDPLDLGPCYADVTAQVDATSTVYADVTGLSVTLVAGKKYKFRAVFICSIDASGGMKLQTTGTATATAFAATTSTFNSVGGSNLSNVTALGQLISQTGVTGGTTKVTIDGSITVNAGGTFKIQLAQAVANGTTSILVGSFLGVNV